VKGRAHSEREEKLAEQLILAYEADFDPTVFKNEHRDRVLSLVEAKAAGKRPRLPALQKKKAAPDLADALKKSLLHAHGKGRGRESERPQLAKARASGRRRKERAVA
jgi:non-homologous end joining protein Ku